MLRDHLRGDRAIVTPGAYDSLTAKLIEEAGFPAVSITGAGVTAARLGAPDLGLISMSEMLETARSISGAVGIPVMADCETGWGGPLSVMRTVAQFEDAGVSSLFLEDQVAERRCGHFKNKQLIGVDEMTVKLRAAVKARRDPDLVLIARTDAIAVTGLDDAINRMKAYLRTGVDAAYVEAQRSREEIERVAAELRPLGKPLYINLVEGGVTPLLTVAELQELGYRIVNYSGSVQKTGIWAMREFLKSLAATGSVSEFYPGRMTSLEERSDLLGLPAYYAIEQELLA
jgi:2-methylisocitrate lyase-like PEP mutase family enzyme